MGIGERSEDNESSAVCCGDETWDDVSAGVSDEGSWCNESIAVSCEALDEVMTRVLEEEDPRGKVL